MMGRDDVRYMQTPIWTSPPVARQDPDGLPRLTKEMRVCPRGSGAKVESGGPKKAVDERRRFGTDIAPKTSRLQRYLEPVWPSRRTANDAAGSFSSAGLYACHPQ